MANTPHRLSSIEFRNKRVELDKKWETSFTRRLAIAILTYVIAAAFLLLAEIPSPYLNALVPTGGYLLSTLSLMWLKKLWIDRFHS